MSNLLSELGERNLALPPRVLWGYLPPYIVGTQLCLLNLGKWICLINLRLSCQEISKHTFVSSFLGSKGDDF